MTHTLSPTTVLPVLATLHACDAACVGEALRALRNIYFPHVPPPALKGAVPVLNQALSEAVTAARPKRAARLVHHDGVPDSGYASAEEEVEEVDDSKEEDREEEEMDAGDEALDILRSDELERGYTIKWLTGLMKRGDTWACASSEEQEARTKYLEDASRLLARFASDDAPEEAVTRTFSFPFHVRSCPSCGYEGSLSPAPPITVELNDAPVDGTDHTAVGLQSWGSAIVFAERMCLDPERYLGRLHLCNTTYQRRVLELGAGTGLLSITATQIFSRSSLEASIKATDYHPSVLENLSQNVRQNRSAVRVSVEKLDWCALPGTDVGMIGDRAAGAYDVVLAADVVYHPEHARWIRGCIERMLKHDGVFWLIIPVRTVGRHQGLGETVEEAFPDVGESGEKRLAVVSREEIAKVDGVGRADEGGYTLFEIRWM